MEIKIVVNDIPPSNNKYMGNSNSFRVYGNDKQLWFQHIAYNLKSRPLVPFKKAEVQITYYFKDKRRRDPDNYSGKFLLDPLVKLGVLKDDNFDVIKNLILKAEYDKDYPRTEIIVREVI